MTNSITGMKKAKKRTKRKKQFDLNRKKKRIQYRKFEMQIFAVDGLLWMLNVLFVYV